MPKFQGIVLRSFEDGCIEVKDSKLECEAVDFINSNRCQRQVTWLNVASYSGFHNYCELHAVTPDSEMELWEAKPEQ